MQPKLPLIRLRVDYTDEYLTLSSNHFGQRFVGKAANPKELILFKCKKGQNLTQRPVADTNLEIIEEIYENEDQAKHCHIDDVINEYFDNVDIVSRLMLLNERQLTDAVKEIVEKDAQSSKIQAIIDWHINSIKSHIMAKGDQVDKILDDQFLIREIMHDFKRDLEKKEENENENLINFAELEQQYRKKRSTASKANSDEPKTAASKAKGKSNKKLFEDEEEMDLSDFYDDEEAEKPQTSRPVSRNDGKAANKNQFAIIEASSDDDNTEDDDVEEVVAPKKAAAASKSTRGRGRGRGRSRGRGSNKSASDYFTVSK